jgi:exopolysaccharide biosynthesis polyprenyl glycosylphosphotransferase
MDAAEASAAEDFQTSTSPGALTHPDEVADATPTADAVLVSADGFGTVAAAEPWSTGVPKTAAQAREQSRTRLLVGLVAWDALVPAVVLTLAAFMEGSLGPPVNGRAADINDPLVFFLGVISPLCLATIGAYRHRRRRDGSRLLFALKLGVVGMAVSWAALIASAVAGWPIDFAQMLALSVCLPPAWLLGRWACDRHPSTGVERVLIVGSGSVADRVLAATTRHRVGRFEVVGRIEADSHPAGDGLPLLGEPSQLAEVVTRHAIDRVLVAFTPGRDAQLLEMLRRCVADGVQVDVVPRFYELVGPSPRSHSIGGIALMEVPARGLGPAQEALKRTVDVVGSLALLVLLSPVMALGAAMVLVDGRPILYRQTRVGQGGRPFSILKFRTMSAGSDASGAGAVAAEVDGGGTPHALRTPIGDLVREIKAESELRVTRSGAIMRALSIDELPQLINVLRGDMSLVGPRPLRPFETVSLSEWQLARQDLRPGLTGLWQVLGRSDLEWDERMELDYAYVSDWSLVSDLRILARTLPAVLKRDGAV